MALNICQFWQVALCCTLQVLAGVVASPFASAQELPGVNSLANSASPTIETRNSAPLFWAEGITRADELGAYQNAGLNTVVVRLEWRPSPDGRLEAGDLTPARQFANAAATRGLKVIYALPPAPFGMERAFRINASSTAYFTLWTAWTQGAITQLRDTPNLIGWMLPDDPRSLPYYDDNGWTRWLNENFADVAFVNRQWQSGFASMEAVTLQATVQAVTLWRGATPDAVSSNEELQAMAERSGKPNGNPEWAFHPASLALAQFKWDAYRQLLSAWASVIKNSDADHRVFSGRLPDYAQLLALPPNIDVSVPDLRPGLAEADALTHNPQAIDLARRGGRFAAIPTLMTSGTAAVAGENLALLWPKWADAALAHGASGLSLSWWPDLLENATLRTAVTRTLSRLSDGAHRELWGQTPIATSAVILTPLADGVTLQIGSNLPAERRGLYGFGDDLVANEPSDLVYALRWGTAFGSVDFLSPDELDARGQTLSRYSTVLMPQALSLPLEQAGALTRYVSNGGVLVADLGAGAAQSGAQVSMMAPALANLFGMAGAMTVRNLSFNLKQLDTHPLLPTWSSQFDGRPGTILTSGDGPRGAAFAGITGYPITLPNTSLLALGDQWTQGVVNANGTAPRRIFRSALSANQVGRGFAVFAPWKLWTLWRPGHDGFDSFHGDLFARNAALAIAGAPSLVPAPATANGQIGFPEIINFSNAVLLLNHNPPRRKVSEEFDFNDTQTRSNAAVRAPSTPSVPKTPEAPAAESDSSKSDSNQSGNDEDSGAQIASVQTAGVGDWLWSDCISSFNPSANFDINAGRAAPINNPDEWQSRPQPVTLHAGIPSGAMRALRLLPIRAQNLSGGPLSALVPIYNAEQVRVTLWPNAVNVVRQNSQITVMGAGSAPVRLTLHGGQYPIAPASRHRVAITDLNPPAIVAPNAKKRGKNPAPLVMPASRTVTQNVVADAQGRIIVEASGSTLSIEVTNLEIAAQN